jgi:glycosyltransferase involved in cell wall biosynthesis
MGLWNGLLNPFRSWAYLSAGGGKIFQRCAALLRRIRVLEVVRPAAGGMKKHVQGLVQGLDKDKFKVFVAASEDETFMQLANQQDIGYAQLGISDRVLSPGDVIACAKLRRLIKTIKPDICHFHGFKAAAIGRIAVALNLLGGSHKPKSRVGIGTRGNWESIAGREDVTVPQVVYTVHNAVISHLGVKSLTPSVPGVRASAFHSSGLKEKMCLYAEHALAKFTHCVITVSKAIYREYSAIPRLGPEKVRHIPNGIDLKRFCMITPSETRQREKAKRDLGCGIGIPVVGLVSRLIPHKGVKTFLLAVASLRQVGLAPQVLIAGDGPSRVELEVLVEELGLMGQVRFLGFIDDMVSFYAALDVFVLSSFSEGMPLALIEAMAAGVPVVATRTGGVEEVVSTSAGGSEGVIISDRGRLVPPGDPEAMATCIQKALLFPQESRMLADKAKAYVRENFSIEQMVRKTEEVYEEVLACRD